MSPNKTLSKQLYILAMYNEELPPDKMWTDRIKSKYDKVKKHYLKIKKEV